MRIVGLSCALVFICAATSVCIAQTKDITPDKCIRFDGKDDYIDFGDIYRDLKLPFTISAWANLDVDNFTHAIIFTNRNCVSAYTGFRLAIDINLISLDFGDGVGEKNPAYRRGKWATTTLKPGTWYHITAVITDNDHMEIYLDGKNVGGDYAGNSSLPMDSNLAGGFATCGYFISNDVEYHFKGSIDEVRLWDKALTEKEVKESMCNKLKGDEKGLVGYWNFNETSGTTVYDKSKKKHHGKFVGNPARTPAPARCK